MRLASGAEPPDIYGASLFAAVGLFYCVHYSRVPAQMQAPNAAMYLSAWREGYCHAVPCRVIAHESHAMPDHYTPSQVASMIGRSTATVRRLTTQYARQLSDSANPPKGEARRYTPEDVAILQLATQAIDAGISRDAVLARLDTVTLSDALLDDMPTPITPVAPSQAPAALALLEDARRQADDAREEAAALRERVEMLQRQLGQTEGELAAYKALRPRRPRWWIWLFGE